MTTTNPRIQYILSALMDHNMMTVSELSEKLGVSTVTVRKDVRALAEQNLIVRQHGKVMLPTSGQQNYLPFQMRSMTQSEEKRCIAAAAAAMIEKNDAIILDSGTTTLAIADQLRGCSPVNLATNSVSIAHLLSESNHMISLAGGQMLNHSMCTAGPDAENFFHSIQAEKAFIGISGVWDDLSLTTGLRPEAATKMAMIQAAKKVIVVAANDKFHRSQMFNFCAADKIDVIITTWPELPPHILQQIERHHIQLIYADTKQGDAQA